MARAPCSNSLARACLRRVPGPVCGKRASLFSPVAGIRGKQFAARADLHSMRRKGYHEAPWPGAGLGGNGQMPADASVHTTSGRRGFLQTVLSGAVAGVAAQAGIELAVPGRLSGQTNLSPEAALQELLEGNQRFAANRLTSIEHDLTVLKDKTVEKQEPFAAILSCADSRVPVELVFDQTIGHIFVTRVAGNLATPER